MHFLYVYFLIAFRFNGNNKTAHYIKCQADNGMWNETKTTLKDVYCDSKFTMYYIDSYHHNGKYTFIVDMKSVMKMFCGV